MENRIKYILTDLDGVIRIWDYIKVRKIEQGNNLESGSIHKLFFEPVLLKKAITGKISDGEWRNEILSKIRTEYPELDTSEITDSVFNEEYRIDHNVIELYKKYFPEASLVLTTNATSRLKEDLDRENILSHFDFIYNSSEIGMIKPQKEYYLRVKEDLNFTFDEVIYIDDSIKNTDAARESGFISHHYRDIKELEIFLKKNA